MAKQKALKVRMVPPGSITPYFNNPRSNDDAVGAVAKSITEYGFNQPIVVDAAGVVIAGHTRLKAALLLKLAEVPVVAVSLSEAKAREYRIADNKTAEYAEWNIPDLVAELREIGDMADFFPMLDVNALLRETAGASFAAPTQGEIDVAQAAAGSHFAERSEEQQQSYARVQCPGCGGEFHVDRREAMREARRLAADGGGEED
jgi:hypothetical protein